MNRTGSRDQGVDFIDSQRTEHLALRFVQAYERRGIQSEQHHALTECVRTLEEIVDHVEDSVD